MIGLWDTTGNEVVKALAAERRSAGGVTSGLALTLIVVVDERQVREAEAAATIAAAAHPCRLLIVVRADGHPRAVPAGRRDRRRGAARAVRGGRHAHAGPARPARRVGRHAAAGTGRAGRHLVAVRPAGADRVRPAGCRGRAADHRRAQSADPIAALRTRADDYAPGDTDLAWTRITPWRTLLAGASTPPRQRPPAITISAPEKDPTRGAAGRLAERAGCGVTAAVEAVPGSSMRGLSMSLSDGGTVEINRADGAVRMQPHRAARPDSAARRPARSATSWPRSCAASTPTRSYAAALAAATGTAAKDLSDRLPTRVHHLARPGAGRAPRHRRRRGHRPWRHRAHLMGARRE